MKWVALGLNEIYLSELIALGTRVSTINLTSTLDQIVWKWTPHKNFTVNSVYKLEEGCAPDNLYKNIWMAKIWLVRQKKVLTKDI